MQDRKLNKIVSQEEFNKLSQLDRIEYRQREDRLNKEGNFSGTAFLYLMMLYDVLLLVGVMAFISNVSLKLAVYVGELAFKIFIPVFIIGFIITLTFDFISIRRKNKAIQKLKDEYFKLNLEIKTKPKQIMTKEYLHGKGNKAQ